MTTFRLFAEIASAYRMRFAELKEEYETIAHKWRYLNSIVMDPRIFEDLSQTVFQVAPRLMDRIDGEISECERIGGTSFLPDPGLERDKRMSKVANRLFLAARFVSYFKSAMHQRTPFMEIPFVIAGEPLSPETRWGDELFLIAADHLVMNYADQLNLYDFKWTGFTSYAPMHPHYERFPGATYTSISSLMYHVTISSELKTFLSNYIVIAHELGHAAIESRETQANNNFVPIIMYRVLSVLYDMRRLVSTPLEKNKEKNRSVCMKCSFRKNTKCISSAGRMGEEKFVDLMKFNKLNELLYEMVSDCIASFISGPYYLRTMFNYAFRNVVSLNHLGDPMLDEHFRKLFTRAVCCSIFIGEKSLEWSDISQNVFENICAETFASIGSVAPPHREQILECLDCLARFGTIIGQSLASEFEYVFQGVFQKAARFQIDPKISELLSKGITVCDAEPRQIVHACFNLAKDEESPLPLFSLANNLKYTRRKPT